MKQCERCKIQIPDDFTNLLCYQCYDQLEQEREKKKKEEEEERKAMSMETIYAQHDIISGERKYSEDKSSYIKSETYQENVEKDDKPQWTANVIQFDKTGKLLWIPTRFMYTYIKDYCIQKVLDHPQYPKFIWKPKIVDVGCGSGIGSNVLSQEGDFVWGIDKNEKSILFAKEAFERQKNNIYYSNQLSFDRIDIMEDTREFLKFDIVVAIEIIEHIKDDKKFLERIISKFTKRTKKGEVDRELATEFFISTPNRNNDDIRKDHPHNIYHVREYTSGEYWNLLSEFFENIEFMNAKGEQIKREEYNTTTHTPILAKCSIPKIPLNRI